MSHHLPLFAVIEMVTTDRHTGAERAIERRICRVVSQVADPHEGLPVAWMLPMVSETTCSGGFLRSDDTAIRVRLWADDLTDAKKWLAACRHHPGLVLTMPDDDLATFDPGNAWADA